MDFLISSIKEVKTFISRQKIHGRIREFHYNKNFSWPVAGSRDIVMKSDTGLELGNPQDESVSFLLWTTDSSLITDGLISLSGPDIGEATIDRLSFGKVVLVSGKGFDETNCCERFHEMDLLRYNLSFKGYMMRAVSQHMREWSRISVDAVKKGFSVSLLGNGLIQLLKDLDYIDTVEILFVTSSTTEVRELKKTGDRLMQYINAISKMTTDQDFDCDACEFQDVCAEAEELRDIHQSFMAS
jgi:CO dehydrogenase/acetyl-CoA synthase beta subunit